jgi:hypothetical protein
MDKQLRFNDIINHIIGEINEAKRKSASIYHAGNISSSGDEVEDLVREKISLFLPEKYLVRQGHIVNSQGQVSNQFDIIIFDRLSTPKFFESKNNTVFYPIESVLAVGEIKKTLRSNDIVDFGKKIKFLKVDMKRKLIENTAYGEVLNPNSTLFDTINMSMERKYKNPLFSFIFAIDVEDADKLEVGIGGKFMPNDVYVLNYGLLINGKIENNRIIPCIEDENPEFENLIEIKKPGVGCLATMFNNLINHLNNCFIEPFGLSGYMTDKDIYGAKKEDIKTYSYKKTNPEN